MWSLLFKKNKLFIIDHNELKVTDLMGDLGPKVLE